MVRIVAFHLGLHCGEHLDDLLLLSQVYYQEAELEAEQQGLELASWTEA